MPDIGKFAEYGALGLMLAFSLLGNFFQWKRQNKKEDDRGVADAALIKALTELQVVMDKAAERIEYIANHSRQ